MDIRKYLNDLPNGGKLGLLAASVVGITMLTKKGKVRTLSGKPHRPRQLVKDKNISPEEAAKRKSFNAESKRRGPFVFPKRKAYPIGDLKHAKKALIYSTWPDNKSEAKTVRRKVFKRYPKLRKWFLDGKYDAEEFRAEDEWTLSDVGISVYGNRPSLGGCRKCGGSLGSWDSDLKGFKHDDCIAYACVCASMGKDECEVHQENGNTFWDDFDAEEFGAETKFMKSLSQKDMDRIFRYLWGESEMTAEYWWNNSSDSEKKKLWKMIQESNQMDAESFEAWENPDICLMCGGDKGNQKWYCCEMCSKVANQSVSALGGTAKGRGYRRGDIAKAVKALKEYGSELTANQWAARIRDTTSTTKEMVPREMNRLVAYLNPDIVVKSSRTPRTYKIIGGDCYIDWVRGKYKPEGFDAESKCACGCSIGKCGCDEGCKCGCNHKKGGAKWAQAESFGARRFEEMAHDSEDDYDLPARKEAVRLLRKAYWLLDDMGVSSLEGLQHFGPNHPKSQIDWRWDKDEFKQTCREAYAITSKLYGDEPDQQGLKDGSIDEYELALLIEAIRNDDFEAEEFGAEVCPCGCAMKGCVCSSSCKGECLNAESFNADPTMGGGKGPRGPSDDERDEPGAEDACYICNRPYQYSNLAFSLAAHWFKESDAGEKDWKSKKNPNGLPRTARNIAGYYLANYGTKALEQYLMELNIGTASETKITPLVAELLRRSVVPSIMAGDVVNFIETLEIEGVEEEDKQPKFGKSFEDKWEAEPTGDGMKTYRVRVLVEYYAEVEAESQQEADAMGYEIVNDSNYVEVVDIEVSEK